MPLNEQEQKILDEIERRFYEEDPALASAVRTITPRRRFGLSKRVAIVVLVLGVMMLAGAFSGHPIGLVVAVAGFVLMVWSATTLVQGFWRRPPGSERLRAPSDG